MSSPRSSQDSDAPPQAAQPQDPALPGAAVGSAKVNCCCAVCLMDSWWVGETLTALLASTASAAPVLQTLTEVHAGKLAAFVVERGDLGSLLASSASTAPAWLQCLLQFRWSAMPNHVMPKPRN